MTRLVITKQKQAETIDCSLQLDDVMFFES